MKQHKLSPQFIDEFPSPLEPGVLYISMEYAASAHLCCCGCGHEVNAALSPRDWKMTYDGESVSLWPSIGNWGLPCRSHYVIDQNRVEWAGEWSKEEIEAGRQRDRKRKLQHFGEGTVTPAVPAPSSPTAPVPQASRWTRFLNWLGFGR